MKSQCSINKQLAGNKSCFSASLLTKTLHAYPVFNSECLSCGGRWPSPCVAWHTRTGHHHVGLYDAAGHRRFLLLHRYSELCVTNWDNDAVSVPYCAVLCDNTTIQQNMHKHARSISILLRQKKIYKNIYINSQNHPRDVFSWIMSLCQVCLFYCMYFTKLHTLY